MTQHTIPIGGSSQRKPEHVADSPGPNVYNPNYFAHSNCGASSISHTIPSASAPVSAQCTRKKRSRVSSAAEEAKAEYKSPALIAAASGNVKALMSMVQSGEVDPVLEVP